MGMVHGPNLVTDGLQFYIDPSNVQCYPGSGYTLNDLSGNGRDATMYKYTGLSAKTTSHDITVSGGFFNMPTSGHFNFISVPNEVLHGLNTFTIEIWAQISSITGGINSIISIGDDNNLLIYWTSHTALQYENYPMTQNLSYATTANTTFLFTVTGLSNAVQLYKNAVAGSSLNVSNATNLIATATFGEIVLGQEYDSNTTGNFDTGQSWLGKYGPIKFYNRALTAAEVLQNYNAHKSRYGL